MSEKLREENNIIVRTQADNEMSIRDVLQIVWDGKLLIITISTISILLSIIFINNAEFKYSVSMKVIPVSKPNVKNVSQNVSSFSSIIGMDLGDDQKNSYDYELYKILITSNQVSDFLSEDKNFMTMIFSSEWDKKNKKWKKKELTFFSKIKNFIKSILGLPLYVQGEPSSMRLNKFLSNNISIYSPEKSKTSMLTISMLTSNPDLGRLVLENVHEVSNQILRKRSSIRTREYISFLNSQLSKTTQHDHKLGLISTLSSQLQKQMNESSNLPFASEKFGKVVVSQNPVSPNSKFILISSAIIGFFLSIIVLMIRSQVLKVS